MNKQIIEHFIPKKAEGTYYAIRFQVPEGMERITVSYHYARVRSKIGRPAKMVNIVDMGLMDEQGRFLGWSGSVRDTVYVSPHASTKGYLMTDIRPGQWIILVGAYRIPNEGLSVRYEISFTLKAHRWLTGDLHIHSDASDGQHDIPTLAKMAKKAGLDFIAVSNHNNYSENLHLPAVPGLTLLPAVEWTHYRGHMNFFGVPAPFDNSFVADNEQEMLVLVAAVKQKGALISVNHPKCNFCPYLWRNEECFDMVEVWNGPMRCVNLNAIAWWHGLLLAGRRLPLVGGSDYHRDMRLVRFAHPVTRVYAASRSTTDILSALAQGHSYVAASLGGILLDLRCGDAIMGDAVLQKKDGQALNIFARRLKPGMELRLVTSEGVAVRWRHFKAGACTQVVPVEVSWRFAYLMVTRRLFGADFVFAISNPIYFIF